MPLNPEEIAPLVSRVVNDTFVKRYDGYMMPALDAMKLADLKHALIRNLVRVLEAEVGAGTNPQPPAETVFVYSDGEDGGKGGNGTSSDVQPDVQPDGHDR
jgi:hypothetical protein